MFANNRPSFDLVKPLLSRLLPPEFLTDFRTPWKSMRKTKLIDKIKSFRDKLVKNIKTVRDG